MAEQVERKEIVIPFLKKYARPFVGVVYSTPILGRIIDFFTPDQVKESLGKDGLVKRHQARYEHALKNDEILKNNERLVAEEDLKAQVRGYTIPVEGVVETKEYETSFEKFVSGVGDFFERLPGVAVSIGRDLGKITSRITSEFDYWWNVEMNGYVRREPKKEVGQVSEQIPAQTQPRPPQQPSAPVSQPEVGAEFLDVTDTAQIVAAYGPTENIPVSVRDIAGRLKVELAETDFEATPEGLAGLMAYNGKIQLTAQAISNLIDSTDTYKGASVEQQKECMLLLTNLKAGDAKRVYLPKTWLNAPMASVITSLKEVDAIRGVEARLGSGQIKTLPLFSVTDKSPLSLTDTVIELLTLSEQVGLLEQAGIKEVAFPAAGSALPRPISLDEGTDYLADYYSTSQKGKKLAALGLTHLDAKEVRKVNFGDFPDILDGLVDLALEENAKNAAAPAVPEPAKEEVKPARTQSEIDAMVDATRATSFVTGMPASKLEAAMVYRSLNTSLHRQVLAKLEAGAIGYEHKAVQALLKGDLKAIPLKVDQGGVVREVTPSEKDTINPDGTGPISVQAWTKKEQDRLVKVINDRFEPKQSQQEQKAEEPKASKEEAGKRRRYRRPPINYRAALLQPAITSVAKAGSEREILTTQLISEIAKLSPEEKALLLRGEETAAEEVKLKTKPVAPARQKEKYVPGIKASRKKGPVRKGGLPTLSRG